MRKIPVGIDKTGKVVKVSLPRLSPGELETLRRLDVGLAAGASTGPEPGWAREIRKRGGTVL